MGEGVPASRQPGDDVSVAGRSSSDKRDDLRVRIATHSRQIRKIGSRSGAGLWREMRDRWIIRR